MFLSSLLISLEMFVFIYGYTLTCQLNDITFSFSQIGLVELQLLWVCFWYFYSVMENLFWHLGAEQRWWVGFAHWRSQYYVWFCAYICYLKIAWWRSWWWWWSNGKRTQMDFGTWKCFCNNVLGENVAFSSVHIILSFVTYLFFHVLFG